MEWISNILVFIAGFIVGGKLIYYRWLYAYRTDQSVSILSGKYKGEYKVYKGPCRESHDKDN